MDDPTKGRCLLPGSPTTVGSMKNDWATVFANATDDV